VNAGIGGWPLRLALGTSTAFVAVAGVAYAADSFAGGRHSHRQPNAARRPHLGAAPEVLALRAPFVINDRAIAAAPSVVMRAETWNGEAYTTTDGKQISIYQSSTYTNDPTVRQSWVPFISGLVHGDEMNGLAVYMAPLSEVTQMCGSEAIGCYSSSSNYLIIPGDRKQVSMDQVLLHEYGHRVAAYRSNDPWAAAHYGPKYWATYAGVCQRVQQGNAFPGDEGVNYPINPGEAFAETYREMMTLQYSANTWLPTGPQAFLTPSFPNDTGAYDAVRQDVTSPWTGPHTSSWGGALQRAYVTRHVKKTVFVKGKRKTKTVTTRERTGAVAAQVLDVSTPLDGVLQATVETAPTGTALGVYDSTGTTPIGPVGVTSASFTVCGQRSIKLILRSSFPGTFKVSLSVP
jgi:hypothetical protein